jgi:hypothetical protein
LPSVDEVAQRDLLFGGHRHVEWLKFLHKIDRETP